jgi:hypothetical protein
MTKKQFIIILFILLAVKGFAQKYEFGLGVGAGNYIGDIGQEYYFNPNKLGGGLAFKSIFNPWFGARLNLNYYQLEANDLESESLGRQVRKMAIDGYILDISAGIEYNFLPRNPFIKHKRGQNFTPYMFTGIGLSSYNGKLYKRTAAVSKYSGAAFNIPMILGFKYQFAPHLLFSVEAGARYFFTDNLDGTEFYYGDTENLTIIPSGNPNSNDWHTFTFISLIYTFGDLTCYFNL